MINSVANGSAAHEISDSEFALLIAPFEPLVSPIAIAVSGGADSMGLAGLMAAWATQKKRSSKELVAFIVDHGLRDGSAQEAKLTQNRLTVLGIEAHILNRDGGILTSAIQAQAREARYQLLNEACKERGCLHLLTAHHAGDQAETVAMRKIRSKSNDSPGLAGMPLRRITGQTELLRPLLQVAPERLVATCKARGLNWVEDPSNLDRRFERVRVRQYLEQKKSEQDSLLSLAAQIDYTRKEALQTAIDLVSQTAFIHSNTTISINIQGFLKGDFLAQTGALALCLVRIGAPIKPVSFEKKQLERAIIVSFKQGRQTSLGRCVLSPKKGQVTIYRDPRIVTKRPPQPFCAEVIADSR